MSGAAKPGEVLLPEDLISAVREARAVPFLGAGASFGAHAVDGSRIPLGNALKTMIAEKFLGGGYEDASFATVCDFAASARDVRTLQSFIHDALDPYQPATYHLLLAELRWAGIATTNYDLVVERAYHGNPRRAQELLPFCHDADRAPERLSPEKALYVKLHGCITNYQIVHPPLVASTEQLVNFREGRLNQFKQFLEWGQTKTVIFAGYGMGDPNLRSIVDELRRELDKRPRHFLVRPSISEVERGYWADRRITTIDTSFEGLLQALTLRISTSAASLAAIVTTQHTTTFTRFISVAGRFESARLREYLRNRIEHLSESEPAEESDPSRFYRGFDLGWYPFSAGLDVPRRVGAAIFAEQITTTSGITDPRLCILKAYAGGGKSVVIRRLAWDAAKGGERLVFYVKDPSDLEQVEFEEIVSLTNKTIYLFIDNVAEEADRLSAFVRHAKRQRWPLVVVGGARVNEWNIRCESLAALADEAYNLEYLNNIEIDGLLDRLDIFESLGDMAGMNRTVQRERLRDIYGRQILVALHEATKTANFRDIIRDEFTNITPAEARLLYRDVCLVHRLGPPVRAGLIARLHGVPFEEFQTRFFRPLEEVVDATWDRKVSDFVYKSRHPYISQMVFEESLPSVGDRFEAISNLITKLNPSYSYDQEVISELIRAGKLSETFSDRTMGAAIYEAATKSLGQDAFVLHQHGIYEMRLAGDMGALDRAHDLFARALELKPGNLAIRHSLAELSLKRSGIATDPAERDAWRRKAESAASALVRNGGSSHSSHTLAKAAIAELRDALSSAEGRQDDLSEEVLNEAVKKAEDAVRQALQRFPNDDRLLTEEAALNEILRRADRALASLQKAFRANPKSELVCHRLAKMLLVAGHVDEALTTLRTGLDNNPGSQSLNYDMADALRQVSPDADTVSPEPILYHLKRAFADGDRHYEAQFWYARQLCLAGQPLAARPLFERLKKVSMPLENRLRPRGIVLSAEGGPVSVFGVVTRMGHSYGFARADLHSIDTFIKVDSRNPEFDLLRQGDRIEFSLGFNFSGPVAVNVKI